MILRSYISNFICSFLIAILCTWQLGDKCIGVLYLNYWLSVIFCSFVNLFFAVNCLCIIWQEYFLEGIVLEDWSVLGHLHNTWRTMVQVLWFRAMLGPCHHKLQSNQDKIKLRSEYELNCLHCILNYGKQHSNNPFYWGTWYGHLLQGYQILVVN